jgi:hypothetical protein
MFQTLYQRHPRLLAEILDMKTMMVGCAAGEAHLDGGNDAARADFRDLCARDQDRALCPRPKSQQVRSTRSDKSPQATQLSLRAGTSHTHMRWPKRPSLRD